MSRLMDGPNPFTEGFKDAEYERARSEDTNDTTWKRIDTSAFLAGTMKPELPTMLMRSDGNFLMYPGKSHSFYGESESCKSWVLQHESAVRVNAGENVLYLDFEDDMTSVVGRLISLGARPDAINEHLHYYRPEQSPYTNPVAQLEWETLLATPFTLAVIDGVTQALCVFGKKSENNDDVAGWMTSFVEKIAKKTGAAVGLIDHVTKSNDGRGRFAIGAQSKLSAITGAAYMVELRQGFGRGKVGRISIRVAKDRPGAIRACSGMFRSTDRTQHAADVELDATDPQDIKVRVWAPKMEDEAAEASKPTFLMERASRILEESKVPLSGNDISALMKGKKANNTAAITALIADGFAKRIKDTNTAPIVSVKPYRQPAVDGFDYDSD